MNKHSVLDDLYIARPAAYLALAHHRTHKNKPLELTGRPFLRDIYLDNSDNIVIMKSTQSGITEFLMPYAISESWRGRSVFYVLPNDNLVTRYIQNRLNRTTAFTPIYQQLLNDTDSVTARADSVRLKMYGSGVVAFVGSNSPANFVEFPADTVIVDELEECHAENLEMAKERLSASKKPKTFKVSNPRIECSGIDYEFGLSDKKYWHIKCDKCGFFNRLDFFRHIVEKKGGVYVVRDSRYDGEKEARPICEKCGKPFDRFGAGKWIATQKSKISGYQQNKLYSAPNVTINELIERFDEALKSDIKLQRFYNADLGLPYSAAGSKITHEILNDCIDNYQMPGGVTDGACVMGVDVGSKLHTTVFKVEGDKLRLVFSGELDSFEDVREVHKRYRVKFGVIDNMPEQRLSKRVCFQLRGFFRCTYTQTKDEKVNIKNRTVTVNRTESLDAVKEFFTIERIILPANAATIPDFYDQLTASTRVLDAKSQQYIWNEGSKADHYHHSINYAVTAYRLMIRAKGAK